MDGIIVGFAKLPLSWCPIECPVSTVLTTWFSWQAGQKKIYFPGELRTGMSTGAALDARLLGALFLRAALLFGFVVFFSMEMRCANSPNVTQRYSIRSIVVLAAWKAIGNSKFYLSGLPIWPRS
jgi:hypothetical protein